MEKNTTGERSEGCGDFFSANPQGTVLAFSPPCSEICLRKSQWRKWSELKRNYKTAAKNPGGLGDANAKLKSPGVLKRRKRLRDEAAGTAGVGRHWPVVFLPCILFQFMEKSENELGKPLANSLAHHFEISGSLMGIARAQAELQRRLKPYQGIIETTRNAKRMAELSGVMGIAHVLQEQAHKWNTNYSGIIGISQAIQQRVSPIKPSLMSAYELARALPKNLNMTFPGNYNSAIASIASQHQELFQSSRKMMPFLSSPVASQLTSMQIALNGISGSIAKLVAQQGQWDLMDDFETASTRAMEISDEFELSEETETTFRKLVDFVVSFIKRNRKVGLYALRFVEVVIMIAALHQYYYFLQAKPEMASKEDLKKMESRLVKAVAIELNKEHDLRKIARNCRVYLKPKTKSQLLFTLKAEMDIIVLQVNHKWLYISFTDPNDHYAETGWVLKKYLKK